ncbi:helix-turn-helix domain-containing protein [Agrococcus jejuensis]|uniref:helix-turn-helix domain-containing protein n=1 Tax=Agrococcus jejuensis TaxID=399736 RepID=UPI0011A93610|nr:helix-turn-helix domain-containing protein [Agrococcus jejuensis]
MSVEAMVLALHHSRATGTTKVVLMGIANHHGDGGSWPAIATLADYANVTRDSARKHIAKLESMGEIRRQIQGGGTRSMADHERPNRYDILLRCPADCDGTTAHRTRRKAALRGPAPLLNLEGGSELRGASDLMGDPPSESTPEPSSQPSTHTPPASHVGNRVRARRGDGTTCWAIFHTPTCSVRYPSGQPHRYSEPMGCCPDCREQPIEKSAA